MHKYDTAAECAAAVRGLGYRIAVASFEQPSSDAMMALEQLSFARPVALVFGGRLGVSAGLTSAADWHFTLQLPGIGPTHGVGAQPGRASVDMSVAVALTLHWAWMQRTTALRAEPDGLNTGGGDLGASAVEELLQVYRDRGRRFKRDHRIATARLG